LTSVWAKGHPTAAKSTTGNFHQKGNY